MTELAVVLSHPPVSVLHAANFVVRFERGG
jgi:hypothetical protein